MIFSITIAVLVCLLIAYYFTWQPNKGEIFFNKNPLWFAHRGALLTEPENTIASYIEAQNKGLPAIELDVVSTKDSVVVCSHNFDLERETNGKGYIHHMNREDLLEIQNDGNEQIPTLEEALDNIKDPVRVNIEIKTSKMFDIRTALLTAKIIERKQLFNRVMLSSFNPMTLWVVKMLYKSILTGYIIEQRGMLPRMHLSRADCIHPRSDLVTEKLLHFAGKKGLRIIVWTVNTKPAINWLCKKGVDGIITDRLEFYSPGEY